MSKEKNSLSALGSKVPTITERFDELFTDIYRSIDAVGKLGVGFFEIPIHSEQLTKEDVDGGMLERDLKEFGEDPDVRLIADKEEKNYRIRIYTTPEGIHTVVTTIPKDKQTIE